MCKQKKLAYYVLEEKKRKKERLRQTYRYYKHVSVHAFNGAGFVLYRKHFLQENSNLLAI